GGGQRLAGLAKFMEAGGAVIALAQVRHGGAGLDAVEATIEEIVDAVAEVLAAHGCVRTGARCARDSRNLARARERRERTVPILMPSVAAISSYDRPSISLSTTAARYSGGNSARASMMSAPKFDISKASSGWPERS